eukprot:3203525-Prymnesium_polylepis.1
MPHVFILHHPSTQTTHRARTRNPLTPPRLTQIPIDAFFDLARHLHCDNDAPITSLVHPIHRTDAARDP